MKKPFRLTINRLSADGEIIKYVVPFLALVGLVLSGIFLIPQWMAANSPTVVTESNVGDIEDKLTEQFSRLVQEIVAIQDVERAKKAKVRVDEAKNIVYAMKFDGVSESSLAEMADALETTLTPVENYQCHVEGVTEVLSEPLRELRDEVARLRSRLSD